jgi:membrane protease YdiL (CAAX protease family)
MNLFSSDDGRLRSGWRFALSVVLVLAANFIAIFFAVTLAGRHRQLFDVIYRPVLVLLQISGFILLTNLFDRPAVTVWQYNGLPRRHWLRDTMAGALLGFVLVGIAVVTIAVFFHLSIVSLRFNPRTITMGLVVFAVILAAAMAEELPFRGYPFQRLVEGVGPVGAILVLSALFGAIHMSNPHVSDSLLVRIAAFSNTLLIGIVLALGYLRTRALWFPFGLHFAWNAALGLFFGLPVSGTNDFSVVVRSRASGPDWFLGGGYGIEGGFLGTLVILLGLAYVIFFVKPVALEPAPAVTPIAEFPPASIQTSSESSAEL